MKKLFTILALVLTVALCASFAVSAETLTETLTALGTTAPQNVTLDYDPINEATVYSVDVAWDDLAFSYDAGDKEWKPANHSYETKNARWTNTDGSITVTNHSNAAVAVTVAYTDATDGDVDVSLANGTFKLDRAVAGTELDEADAKTATLTVNTATSTVPTADATVGTVTVTIAAVVTES